MFYGDEGYRTGKIELRRRNWEDRVGDALQMVRLYLFEKVAPKQRRQEGEKINWSAIQS